METDTIKTPPADQVYGWRDAVIESASERTARSGQPKLVVRFIINDAAAPGAIVYGHVPLGDAPRAKALVRSLKQALCVPDASPLPDASQLAGKSLRVRVSPWVGMDGRTRDSVTGFAALAKQVSADDNTVTVTAPADDTPF